MMLLPIVERELRVAARLAATYRNRALTAGVVAGIAMVMLLFGSFVQMPSLVGGAMFKTPLAGLTFLFCALEGVRKTADCLSEEKREGTLGLLFLTDLKGYDVVLGKLTATSLNSIYGFFAILPVLALPLLMGGVTPGEFWRVVLALLDLLFFSLCTGIWVSCRNTSEYRAMGWTLCLIVCFIFAPFLTFSNAVYPFSPAFPYHAAFAPVYSGSGDAYWLSLGITQILSWTLLICSSFSATRCWQEDRIDAPSPDWWWRGDADRRTELRMQLLETNPASWLAGRNRGPRLLLVLIVLAAAVNSAVHVSILRGASLFLDVRSFLVVVGVLNLLLKMLMAAQACHCLAEARRNNALEMLLATPLSVDQIIRGQLSAFKRIFLTPTIVVLVLEIAGPLGGLVRARSAGEAAGEVFAVIAFAAFLGMFFSLDAFAVLWAGMWFGLTSKKEGEAIAKTILFVLLIPLSSLLLTCIGAPFFIGIPIFWIVWSHQKLYGDLRRIAATPQATNLAETGWLPIAGSSRV